VALVLAVAIWLLLLGTLTLARLWRGRAPQPGTAQP
jgi:hypothetical protein